MSVANLMAPFAPLHPPVRLVPKPDRREQVVQHIAQHWPLTPGLRLTAADVALCWQLSPATCEELLETLVRDEVIVRYPDRTYGPRVAGREMSC
jgi:hypothetical protein